MAIERKPTDPCKHLRPDPDARFRDELDELFSHYFEPSNGMDGGIFAVSFDTSETEDASEITLDVPGVEKEDIDISSGKGRLTISQERKRKEVKRRKSFDRTDRSSGSFQTLLALPEEADDAKLRDGVLKLTVPKSEKARSSAREIAIKTS